MLRTIGVDLAVEPRRTAAVEIQWSRDGAVVLPPKLDCGDDYLIDLLAGLGEGECAGIDCPFGWPTDFVEAVLAHAGRRPWPAREEGRREHYARMRLRATDLITDQVIRPLIKRGPLSVSMDKLGAIAARWAYLADQLEVRGRPVDRSGAGRVVEVYPAGARAVWRLARPRSVPGLLQATAPWLTLESEARQVYENNNDAFDALIAALAARAAALGQTARPRNEQEVRAAATEGWIHLPGPAGLAALDPRAA